jgi:HEPN domain-containing protein
MPARNPHSQAVRIRWRLSAPVPLDLLVRTPYQMAWRLREGESFTTTVVSQGKVLYEKDDQGVVKKAEQDYVIAKQASRSKVPVHDGVCFHCQQCAEKYLKGLMEEVGLSVPKIHDLEQLLGALVASYPTIRAFRRGLVFLTDFAVETRYPGANASKRQALAALRWATRVRTMARQLLGL